jgi:histone-lysine N-methyltransferase SUV420H
MIYTDAQHDCKSNLEFVRNGKCVTFRVIRSIAVGEELTVYYGDNYCKWAQEF